MTEKQYIERYGYMPVDAMSFKELLTEIELGNGELGKQPEITSYEFTGNEQNPDIGSKAALFARKLDFSNPSMNDGDFAERVSARLGLSQPVEAKE